MANTCLTQITFYSECGYEIEELKNKLEELYYKPEDRNYCVTKFLKEASYKDEFISSGGCGCVRSFVSWFGGIMERGKYTVLYLDVEDAWVPSIEPWRLAIDGLWPFNTIKIAWLAEEPGCGVYLKYDPDNLFFDDMEYCYDTVAPDYPIEEEVSSKYYDSTIMTEKELLEFFEVNTVQEAFAKAEHISKLFENAGGFATLNKYKDAEKEY